MFHICASSRRLACLYKKIPYESKVLIRKFLKRSCFSNNFNHADHSNVVWVVFLVKVSENLARQVRIVTVKKYICFSFLFMKKILHYTGLHWPYALLRLMVCLSTCIIQPSYGTILMGFYKVIYAFRFFSLAPTNPQNWNFNPVKSEEIVEKS